MIRPEAIDELVAKKDADFSTVMEASTFMGNQLRLGPRSGAETLMWMPQSR